MSEPPATGRRPASSIDPTRTERPATGPANALFRPQALAQLDVAAEIDNQLPLVPRRTWLIVLGIALVAAGGIIWAALTPSQTSVTAQGRALAGSGITELSTMATGVLGDMLPGSGTAVAAGATVFEVHTPDGVVPVSSMTAGTVWQVLAGPGTGVQAGEVLGTVLPDGSDRSVLLAVPEAPGEGVAAGQQVVVQGRPNGTVTGITPPLPAAQVATRTGLSLPESGLYLIVTVSLDEPLPPGTEVSGRIVLSDRSVLQSLLGLH